jgi:hypothetical protein
VNKGTAGPVQGGAPGGGNKSTGAAGGSSGGSGGSERRANVVLRALIDEMLERVRELNRNSHIWNEDQIARAEAELDAIMARVRKVAINAGDH